MQRHFSVAKLPEYLQRYGASKIVFIDEAGRQETTYESLARLVDDRVRALREADAGPRRRVGLLGGSSLSWMAWDLATIANDNVPLAFLDEHATHKHDELMARYDCQHLVLTDVPDARALVSLPPSPGERSRRSNDPPDLLSLVFSSGTTGRTKGLKISRKGLEHILDQFTDGYKLSPNDRYYSFLPFNYFQQRALYYAALAVGADIIVVRPRQFLQHFATERPTYCVNPPAFYEAIYNHYRALQKLNRATTLQELLGGNIRWMITAMAPIKRAVLDFFWQNGVGLYETYGVTETGLVAWNTLDDYKVGTVGKPAADGEIIISDDGEVLIRRKAPLALGYFDASGEDEREVFREDGSIATGDVATMDQDGYITLVGRTKNAIVTTQGLKFHPEELERRIEMRLPQHVPVVIGGANVCDNTLILAPRTADDGVSSTPESVRAAVEELNASTDAYKNIRAAYLLQEPFSVASGHITRNFKLDRRKLQSSLLSGSFVDKRVV